MTRSCRSFKKFQTDCPSLHVGRCAGCRPSSVGRVTAQPPAAMPSPPDAPSAGSTGQKPAVTKAPTTSYPQVPIGRIPVQGISPVVDDGARPAKAVVGEQFTIGATVFREGH